MHLLPRTSQQKLTLRTSRRSSDALTLRGFHIPHRVVSVLCLITVCGTLAVGLWPFCAPENEVTWAKNENALRFGENGMALSSRRLDFASANASAGSLEVWVLPTRLWTTKAILAFYDSQASREFMLEQKDTDLVLRLSDHDRQRLLRIRDVFRKSAPFISVSSNGGDTRIYIDGQLTLESPDFGLSSRDLSGQLIVANAPLFDQSWAGRMKGLAIYASELNAAQVLKQYRDWTLHGQPTFSESEKVLAVYLFREHQGNTVHNEVPSGVDLTIPRRFMIIDQLRFQSPVSEFYTQGSYLKNVLINVTGFVPLGFMVTLYFAAVRRMSRAAIAAVLVGAAVSFTIEYFQSFLPTRYSGWTDIITNTVGTAIGVALYGYASRFVAAKSRVGSLELNPSSNFVAFQIPSTILRPLSMARTQKLGSSKSFRCLDYRPRWSRSNTCIHPAPLDHCRLYSGPSWSSLWYRVRL